ncbi:E3 ubiquitin- ligase MARCH3-like [Chlorella sorokiniana]|uniref:E3 ubiquitin-ligase MARCH3-like n=1 Tax=Chlorella sorokiniana TaxID=3076 RepID=A0A2P6TH82_CHLSO|nr:E3 ubiquitin- ligase MARCH3-like [Chlorella sorokiniana]|eukprot:PRW33644.1 E3 ubiquitin- ligase MARCH3-like [Chlorella sorokiniana]
MAGDLEAQEAPFCRICWAEEPPRGLADVLLDQPCGCRGYMARVHLSCLHAWQLQQLSAQPLADTATCGVCRQPYNVPDQLWEALVAAGGIDGDERRRVRQQQLLQQRNPWLLRLLELQRQAAQLRQDLRQAGQQLPTDRLRLAMQQRLQALGQARRTAGLLHVVLPREPEQMAQLQRLRQELKQLQQDYRTFLGADRVGQHTLELAKVLHE